MNKNTKQGLIGFIKKQKYKQVLISRLVIINYGHMWVKEHRQTCIQNTGIRPLCIED